MKIESKVQRQKTSRKTLTDNPSWRAQFWSVFHDLRAEQVPSLEDDPLYADYFEALEALVVLATNGAEPDNRFRAVYDARRAILQHGNSNLSEEFSKLQARANGLDVLSASIAAAEEGGHAATMSDEIKREIRRKKRKD